MIETFYLGTHRPNWLAWSDVPLFVSYNRLVGRKSLPEAASPWALDSGAFTSLQKHGRHIVSAERYAEDVQRFQDDIGRLNFASVQDWMCEPFMLAITGLTIEEHQRLTIESYLALSAVAPDVPWLPVLQGWRVQDYERHVAMYAAAGVDLRELGRVGVGSVCRRQGTKEGAGIIRACSRLVTGLHAFGFKIQGLALIGDVVRSADSMAWSFRARRDQPIPGHRTRHKNCANCWDYARNWYERVVGLPTQLSLEMSA